MRNLSVALIILAALGAVSPLSGRAEDELFDTQAARQHIDKGLTDLKAKSYNAAIKEFEQAAEMDPQAEAYYYLGYTYYLKAKYGQDTVESRKKSRENFDKAYEIDPGFSPTRLKQMEPAPPSGEQQSVKSSGTSSAPAPQEPEAASAPSPTASPDQTPHQ